MKKITATLLCAILVMSVLTGCSPKKDESLQETAQPTLMTFNEGKTYEDQASYASGIVTVSDVIIKNTTFNGDLTIDKSVGEGDVTLDGVNVKGKLIIQGGGSNSVHVDNSEINAIESGKEDSAVRIVISEKTKVDTIDLGGHTNLEVSGQITSLNVKPEAKVTGIALQPNSKVEKVEVNAPTSLLVQAPITDLNLKAASKVSLEAAVENVRVEAAAANSTLALAKGVELKNLATETQVDVSGEGKLTNVLTTDAANVTGNIKAENTTVNENPIQESNKEVVVTTPQPTTTPKPTVAPTKAPATPAPTVEPTVEPTPVPPSTPNPTPIPDKTITVTTPQELKDALAGDKEIITISGTLGSTSDYTAYDVNRAVTINGATGNNVYGTFNIRTSGVTISNINLTIRGGGVDSLKNGINVATKSVSLLNNTFNLPESLDSIGNGVVIWPMGTVTPNYNISNNTFNGFNNKVPNWSSAAIVVAENITSNRLGDSITTTTLGIDETSEVNLAKANLYNDCTYGYSRQDWSIGSDHVITYTNAEIYLSGHVYLAEGTYTENLEIDNDIKIIGTNLNSKIVGTIQVTNTTGADVSLEKLTVEMPVAGYGSNGIVGVTGNANISIVDSKITTENKGQTTSVGVRMTGDGAKVKLKNTDIDVYYYGIGLRNINQELSIDGGTIDGWAAIMTSAGGLGSKPTDTNTKIDIKNAYLNSTAVSNEAYAPVVLQEYYDKVTLTINNSTLNVGAPVVVGAEDKTSALEIRSFGNVVNVSNSTLIAKDATNEENVDTKKKAAAVVRIGASNPISEGAANTIKFINTDMQSKEGEMKFVSYRPLGFQSIDNIWIDGTLLIKEEVAFIGGLPTINTTEFKLNDITAYETVPTIQPEFDVSTNPSNDESNQDSEVKSSSSDAPEEVTIEPVTDSNATKDPTTVEQSEKIDGLAETEGTKPDTNQTEPIDQ